jgi:chemotaxis protein MotB
MAAVDLESRNDWEGTALRRKGVSGAVVFAVTASGMAIVLGYYAWLGMVGQQAAQTKLSATRTQLSEVQRKYKQSAQSEHDLTQQNAEQTKRLAEQQNDLLELKTRLGVAEAARGELEEASAELQQSLAEVKHMTQQFQRMIDSGKLEISYRRGRMIVELPAAVLFASGSGDLSDDGRSALREVAAVLRKVPGKRFIVAGHTDNVPISKAQTGFEDNWALSAARAVTVTQALINAGLHPSHLVAAGYGEYDPVASNTSARGRQKNRRIEIVLEPELREVPAPKAKADEKAGAKAAAEH